MTDMTTTNITAVPPEDVTYTYQVFASGIVEPLHFMDALPYSAILERWIMTRQTLDRLEGNFEQARNEYLAKVDTWDEAIAAQESDDGVAVFPRQPDKPTLTEDLLLTFKGNKDGKLCGSIYVGLVVGIRDVTPYAVAS